MKKYFAFCILFVFSALVVFLGKSSISSTNNKRLDCGKVFDSVTGTILQSHSIFIQGTKISAIIPTQNADENSTDWSIKDLSQSICLPGLIDVHVHFEQTLPDLNFFHHPDEARATIDAIRFPEKTLMAGFTTVRDLLSPRNVALQFRNAINSGKMIGPRILVSGSAVVTAPGGHGDFRGRIRENNRPGAGGLYTSLYGLKYVSSVEDVNNVFKFQFEEKPSWYSEYASSKLEDNSSDVIKVMATGGVLSDNPDSHRRQLNRNLIKATVDNAKEYSLKTGKKLTVAAHAHGIDGIHDAVMAGVDSIEHITELGGTVEDADDQQVWQALRSQVVQEMKQKNIYGVPTLLAAQTVIELAEAGKFPPHIAAKAILVGKKMLENFKNIPGLGIPLAFGTDTGISHHGENWREFELLVRFGKSSGLDEVAALKMATINAAKLLKLDNEIGSIEVGKYADIIATDINLLNDISRIKNISFVMKDGEIYKE